jgi:CoA:oxalate CoA-transferase
MTQRPRPLDGLRVLDLSRAVSGPFAGRILADLGADVVKAELPDTDLTQAYGKVTRGRSGPLTPSCRPHKVGALQ